MKEVIILGEHLLNTLGQIRCFGEAGIHPIVIWSSPSIHSPKGSKYIKKFHSASSPEEGVVILKKEFAKGDKKIISTDSDYYLYLLNEQYEQLAPFFVFFNAKGKLAPCLHKSEQYRLANKYGLSVSNYEEIKRDSLPTTLRYPVYTKSADSFNYYWKRGAAICESEEELVSFFQQSDISSFIVQEYIEKETEVAIEGISFCGGEQVYIPIQGEYIRLPKDGYGSLKRNEPYKLGDELQDSIKRMLKEIEFTGVFEAEFIRDKQGKLYFLEINFRHTQYNHALADMGFNLCEAWYNYASESVIPEPCSTNRSAIVINELKDFRRYVVTKKMSLRTWLKDFRSADSYYLWDKKDWFFVFRFFGRSIIVVSSLYWRNFRQKIKRLI